MCVIAYKAKDVRFPSPENVKRMWQTNPHGAGLMWRASDNRIRFVKGFMKLEDLEQWIERNREGLDAVECAIHFRITTHGGTSPGNCHPFVIGADADPHMQHGTADRILMHNGILPLEPRAKDISDSAELALRLGAMTNHNQTLAALNECLNGNRILVMDADGTHFYGDAFKKSSDPKNDGILYSNLNFEPFDFGFWDDANPKSRGCAQAAYRFDDATATWRETATNREVPIENVDPYDLDDTDYELYELEMENSSDTAYAAASYGISVEEYLRLCEEANACGMDVDRYYSWMYEGEESETLIDRVAS